MKLGVIVSLPLAAAALQTVLVPALGADAHSWWAFHLAWHGVGLVGCFGAARMFRPGDLLWRAWALTGGSFLLPILYRFGVGPDRTWWLTRMPGFESFDVVYALGVNGCATLGAFLFVRAFVAAGLVFTVSDRQRRVAAAASAAVALAIGIPVLFVEVRDALGQGATSDALFAAISSLGDVICFALVAGLARIATEFRGGTLQFTWALLAVANLGYLLYDATMAVVARIPGAADQTILATEAIYCAACVAAGAAGLAHRTALRAAGASRTPAPGLNAAA